MKKLLTLGLFSILLMSCNNTGNGELLEDSVNQTHQNESTNKSKGGPLAQDGYLHIIGETDQMFYMGLEVFPIKDSQTISVLNHDVGTERLFTYCSATYSNGHTYNLIEQTSKRTYWIQHIYPNGTSTWSINPDPTYVQCSSMMWDAFWS